MMLKSLVANISSPLLASFTFEQFNSQHDIEGLLFGEVTSKVIETITDSRICNRKKETYLNIQAIHILDEKVYNHNGAILQEKLNAVLKGKRQNVIGWFKCRHNTGPRLSMREKLAHENLSKHLCSEHPELFLFGLFTSHSSSNLARHLNDFTFFHQNQRNFESIQLRIINLGDSSHADYRTSEASTVCTRTGIFAHLIKDLGESDSVQANTLPVIEDLYSDIWQSLQHMKESVFQTDQTIATLEAEIDFLQKSLEAQQESTDAVHSDPEEIEDPTPKQSKDADPFHFISEMKNKMTEDAKKSTAYKSSNPKK